MAYQRKLKTLSLAQRVEVIELLDQRLTQECISKKFGVGQAVISRIKRDKEIILEYWRKNKNPNRKRKRQCSSEEVGEALFQWFSHVKNLKLSVNGSMLKEKALQFAKELNVSNFTASNGWLERWKTRNNIKFKVHHVEKQNTDSVPNDKWLVEILPTILKEYKPLDIFNVDETVLCWKAMPNKIFAPRNSDTSSYKFLNERVTVILSANMNGLEELQPLVIGKCQIPQSFKYVKHLPVAYEFNCYAWMTSTIWEEWLKKIDCQMRNKNRKIVLLCDNCHSHTNNVHLTNMKLVFLPKNATSIIQPFSHGVIATFKSQYRSKLLQHVLSREGLEGMSEELSNKISLLDALHLVRESWSNVTSEIILHGFRKAGFINQSFDNDIPEPEIDVCIPSMMTKEEFEVYICIDNNLPIDDENAPFFQNIPYVQIKEEPINDTEETLMPPPSLFQAMKSMDTVRSYLEAHGCKTYNNFYKLQNEILQLNKQRICSENTH
ncbi:tigger transposable element-derived protein 4 [Nephila pilipes]|uniref:Tigger transposable element-derived protein 4 n=1 Tax=Nephila pilipes TaxID=299642 RepID=A0A8X6MEC6_NEPPI|nr:tigger transposable element-derived protein 4 [Nephila pilipes]